MEDYESEALKKITVGENLISALCAHANLEGTQKLQRKISQEVKFLKNIQRTKTIKKEHLQCSNLTHFSALVEVLSDVRDCVALNKSLQFCDSKLVVDIINDGGLTWTKVVARNPKSITQICLGETNYGVRSILDQAVDFLNCAQEHPCLFQIPKVVFHFYNGIGVTLALRLEEIGVAVVGQRLLQIDENITYEVDLQSEPIIGLSSENTAHINKVNVDVSTMLAYVSSVTNGSCWKYRYDVPVLKQQAEWEKTRPVKPLLDKFFEGKGLYCCETAYNSFTEILKTVGGPTEKERSEEFFKRVKILKDDAVVPDENDGCDSIFPSVQYNATKRLPIAGKIKERSLVIFTFGDRIKAVTATSNDGFVRAAKQNGIHFVVFVHGSRALTEQKEQTKAVTESL